MGFNSWQCYKIQIWEWTLLIYKRLLQKSNPYCELKVMGYFSNLKQAYCFTIWSNTFYMKASLQIRVWIRSTSASKTLSILCPPKDLLLMVKGRLSWMRYKIHTLDFKCTHVSNTLVVINCRQSRPCKACFWWSKALFPEWGGRHEHQDKAFVSPCTLGWYMIGRLSLVEALCLLEIWGSCENNRKCYVWEPTKNSHRISSDYNF